MYVLSVMVTIEQPLTHQWNTGSVGNTLATPPAHQTRQHWMAGHSSGNAAMWNSLGKNGGTVDRVISISPTGPNNDLFQSGIPALNSAAGARGSQSFEAMLITAPDLKHTATQGAANSSTPKTVTFAGLVPKDITT